MRDGDKRKSPWAVMALLLAVVGGVAALVVVLQMAQEAPTGPVEVAWDQEICAECRMHIGEPAFASQLHTVDGEVLHFDDHGCLFELVDQRSPEVAGMWFRHQREDAWVAADRVRFVAVEHSPMGYNLGAVDASEVGAGEGLSLEEARSLVGEGQAPSAAASPAGASPPGGH